MCSLRYEPIATNNVGVEIPPTASLRRSIVFAPFFSAEMNANRPMSVARVLAEIATVEVVTTDFDHVTKERKDRIQVRPIERIVYLTTLPYRSNVSIVRFFSHVAFSIRAALYFRKNRGRFDIVYVTLPLNVLAWLVLRMAHTQTKIVDVIDIWPDVLPFPSRLVKLARPLFAVWRSLFNRAVARADVMLAVSDSFLIEASKHVHARCQTSRFYIGAAKLQGLVAKENVLTVVYVGNIGRLYDFETLLEVTADLGRDSVQFFIVGDGDRREWLLDQLRQRGVAHQYFGVVYDPGELGSILCRAHIGYNGYVNTSAAFSYKANTYFAAGLPILNSMKGDLQNLVTHHGLGLNFTGGDAITLKQCFAQLNESALIEMSQNSRRFFTAELERTKLRQDMLTFLRKCLESVSNWQPGE